MSNFNNNQKKRTNTSTQIRNLYSEGMCYLNVRFYNTYLSLSFAPFSGTDQTGRSNYDMAHAQFTTVNYENAYALYQTCMDIITEKITATDTQIDAAADAKLFLHHGLDQDGKPETVLTIQKNGVEVPFKFMITEQQVTEMGVQKTKYIHSGLGAFAKTVDGYLTGINADRHLDKLTDDYAALQGGQAGGSRPPYQQNRGGYNPNYKKQYSNGGRPPYQQNGQWQNNRQGPPNQQGLSGYQLPN